MNPAPLVTILTPCYNGEGLIFRLLDSILAQTYKHLELIIVNDGSTDNTERIVLSYRERIEQQGISFVYIYQKNQGVGNAINTGLKKITGKYLCWPDYDDFLEPESVELRLNVLEKNPQYAIVASDAYFRSEDNLCITGLVSDGYKASHEPGQFVHLLTGKSFICSGCFMVRTKEFFETHPSGDIYPSRRGQNYQMLLPVYFSFKRYFLSKPLYNYVRYNSGLSGIEDNGFNQKINTYHSQRDIILNTISSIKMPENQKQDYSRIVIERYSVLIFKEAYINGDYSLLKQEYSRIRSLGQAPLKIKLRYFIGFIKKQLRIPPFIFCNE